MYCVKCGVKLPDGTESCPLCATPVWNPENGERVPTFPDRYPERKNENERLALILTALTVIAEAVLLSVACNVTGGLRWGGIAMLGVALGFIVFVLPLWVKNMPVYVFLAADHIAAGGYLLYICSVSAGKWFLPFAMPVTLCHGLLVCTMAALLIHTKKGRLFLFGGAFILLGGFTMLVELFEHLSFGTEMFVWSVYSASALAAIGLFLILAGIIPPLKELLRRNFFF